VLSSIASVTASATKATLATITPEKPKTTVAADKAQHVEQEKKDTTPEVSKSPNLN